MFESDKEFYTRIGVQIMNLRIQKHYTRESLAEMVDISAKYLYEIEKGKKGCSGYILYKLAQCLDTSIDYIINSGSISDIKIDKLYSNLKKEKKDKMEALLCILYDLINN